MITPYKDACKFTICYQTIICFLISMILDGGQLFQYWSIAIFAYFVSVLMILKRNKKVVDKVDLFYLKYGSLIVVILAPVIINSVWKLKGVI